MAKKSTAPTKAASKAPKSKPHVFACDTCPNGNVYIPALDKNVLFRWGKYATLDKAEIDALKALPHVRTAQAGEFVLEEASTVPAPPENSQPEDVNDGFE